MTTALKLPENAQLEVLDEAPEDESETPQQIAPVGAQIPDSMWNPVAQDILNFVRDEINIAESERRELIDQIAKYKVLYDAPMPDGPKTFPFFGASNLTLPVIKEAVNTLVAQLVQSTLTARPYWVLNDLAEEWEPFVDEIERFLDVAGDRDLKLDNTAIPWIIEAAKLGTSILQVGHHVEVQKMFQVTADGKRVFPKDLIKHDGPKTWNVALQDFYIRFAELDIQDARWCAKKLRMNEVQLKNEENRGRFFGVDRLIEMGKDRGGSGHLDEATEVQEELDKAEPIGGRPWEIFEVWLSWDFGDGKFTELVLYYSPDLDQFIGRQFHPYWHGKRPFVKLGYFPVENRFYDQGLCEMLEQIQEAVSSRFNQRSDNITMSSLKVLLKRKGVRGLQPGDPLYSGKIIEVMDIHQDIGELRLGEIYPSTVQEELLLREYGERLSGLNEAVLGSASPVPRTTASAQLALLQEQAKRIDLTVRSIRKGLNQVGNMAIDLYFQFGTNGKGLAWFGHRGTVIEAVFRLPKRAVELGHAVTTSVPTSTQNRQVKRENALAMFNLLNELHNNLLPLVQALAPEALPDVVREMVRGGQKFLGDVLETFDVSNPEDALAGLAVLERVLSRPEDLGGLEAFQRATEAAEVANKLSGLEDLLRTAEAARSREPGVPVASRASERVPPAAGRAPELDSGLLFGG